MRRLLKDDNIDSDLVTVSFEFQAGSNKMMVLKQLHKKGVSYDRV